MYEDESLEREQAEDVVNPQEAEGEGAQAQEAEGEKSSDSAERSGQTHEDNRRYQAARHSGEQTGYEKALREINDRIARTGMGNPETGEVISSIEDLEGFGKARRKQIIEKIAKDTGRTVAEVQEEEDNKDFLRRARREAEDKSRTEQAEAKQREWIRKDALAFAKAYPDVDLAQLDQDKGFRRFCGSRYGKEPLADLYGDYLEIAGGAAKAASARAESKAGRETGSGSGKAGAESLTAAQQRDLDEWNRAYPGMKMTAKEFLSR